MAFLYNVRVDFNDGSFLEYEKVEGVNFRDGSVSFLFERLKGVELFKKMITVPFEGVKVIDTTIVGIIPELETVNPAVAPPQPIPNLGQQIEKLNEVFKDNEKTKEEKEN